MVLTATIVGAIDIWNSVNNTVQGILTHLNAPTDASFIAHYFSIIIKLVMVGIWVPYSLSTTFIIFIIPMIPSLFILGIICGVLYVIHIIWEYLRIGVNGFIIPGINETVKGALTGVNGAIEVAEFVVDLPNMIGDKFKKIFK